MENINCVRLYWISTVRMRNQSRLLEESFEQQFLKGIIIVYLKWLEVIKNQLKKTSAGNEKHRLYFVEDEMIFKPYYCKTYMATRKIIVSYFVKGGLDNLYKAYNLISKNGRKYNRSINPPVMPTRVKLNYWNRVWAEETVLLSGITKLIKQKKLGTLETTLTALLSQNMAPRAYEEVTI